MHRLYPHDLILGDEGQKVVQDALKVRLNKCMLLSLLCQPNVSFLERCPPFSGDRQWRVSLIMKLVNVFHIGFVHFKSIANKGYCKWFTVHYRAIIFKFKNQDAQDKI